MAAFLLPNNHSIFDFVTQPRFGSPLSQVLFPLANGTLLGIQPGTKARVFFNQCPREVQVLGDLLYKDQPLLPFQLPVKVTPQR